MILFLHWIYSLAKREANHRVDNVSMELSFPFSFESMDRLLVIINYGLLVPPGNGVVFNHFLFKFKLLYL